MSTDLWANWTPTDDDAPPVDLYSDVDTLAEDPDRKKKTPRKKPAPKPLPSHVRPLTDLGNSERLIDRFGTHIRYVGAWKRWLIWDGRRWAPDENNTIAHYAKQTVRTIAGDAPGHVEVYKWAKTSEGSDKLSAMVRLATSDPAIAISPDRLDRDEWLVTCANGTIDLRTGELLPHDPANLCTKMTPVKYDPDATCPVWDAFLDRIFAGDLDTIAYVKRAVGYSLTASTVEQAMFVAVGGGSNGKSTFLEKCREAIGDFSQQLPPETLMEKRGVDGGPNNDVARLRGARFAAAVETGEGGRLAEARVKTLTGGDTVTARFLHAEFFEFRPVAKMWLATNHRPRVSGSDDGIWRRLKLIPFNVKFTDEEKDRDLPSKLAGGLPGILTWIVQGALEWQRLGLGTAAAVKAATADYKAEQDTLGQFLEEETLDDAAIKVSANLLYAAYKAWAANSGEFVVSQKTFGTRLSARGYTNKKLGKERRSHWVGIGLKVQASISRPF